MKNTYESSFEIDLGSDFIESCMYKGAISTVPELLNLEEDKLETIIYDALVNIFSNYIITSVDEDATIFVDWKNFLDNNEHSKSLSIKIKLNTNNHCTKEGVETYLSYYLEVYLYELFMIFNLSIPGSVTLLKTSFNDGTSIKQFSIDNYFFDNCLEWSNSLDWSKMVYIPIEDVTAWYKSLNIGIRQISKNNLERVMFSLLHICKEEIISPNGLIWLAHALESLFGSPKNSIRTTVINRAFTVLGNPKQGSKKIKSMFKEFYDLRSGYVHGEFNIHHPSFNDILDNEIGDYYYKIVDSHMLGFSIVVACLQLMILNHWKEFKFSEEFEGI